MQREKEGNILWPPLQAAVYNKYLVTLGKLTHLRQVVTPDMVRETRWFKSPYVGVVNFKVRKQMS